MYLSFGGTHIPLIPSPESKSSVIHYMKSHSADATEFKLKLSDLSLST